MGGELRASFGLRAVPPWDRTRRKGSRTLMLTQLSWGGSPVEKQRHLVPCWSTMSSCSRAPRPGPEPEPEPEPGRESNLDLRLERPPLRGRDATPRRRRSSGGQRRGVIERVADEKGRV